MQLQENLYQNNIKPSKYTKKVLIYCLIFVFSSILICFVLDANFSDVPTPVSTTSLMAIIMIPFIPFYLYLALLGARRFITKPDTGIGYYFLVLPMAVLCCLIIAALGWELALTVLPWIGFFIFMGGPIIIGVSVFPFLLISGVLELYLIKRSIRKRLIQQTQGFINPKSR